MPNNTMINKTQTAIRIPFFHGDDDILPSKWIRTMRENTNNRLDRNYYSNTNYMYFSQIYFHLKSETGILNLVEKGVCQTPLRWVYPGEDQAPSGKASSLYLEGHASSPGLPMIGAKHSPPRHGRGWGRASLYPLLLPHQRQQHNADHQHDPHNRRRQYLLPRR
jgi:hypothetical protein